MLTSLCLALCPKWDLRKCITVWPELVISERQGGDGLTEGLPITHCPAYEHKEMLSEI